MPLPAKLQLSSEAKRSFAYINVPKQELGNETKGDDSLVPHLHGGWFFRRWLAERGVDHAHERGGEDPEDDDAEGGPAKGK